MFKKMKALIMKPKTRKGVREFNNQYFYSDLESAYEDYQKAFEEYQPQGLKPLFKQIETGELEIILVPADFKVGYSI